MKTYSTLAWSIIKFTAHGAASEKNNINGWVKLVKLSMYWFAEAKWGYMRTLQIRNIVTEIDTTTILNLNYSTRQQRDKKFILANKFSGFHFRKKWMANMPWNATWENSYFGKNKVFFLIDSLHVRVLLYF